jgi:hypothetical protein
MPRVAPVFTTVVRPGAASQQQALPPQNPQQAQLDLAQWADIPRHNSNQAFETKRQISTAIAAAVLKGVPVPAIEANYDASDGEELIEAMRKQGIQVTLVPPVASHAGQSVVSPFAPRLANDAFTEAHSCRTGPAPLAVQEPANPPRSSQPSAKQRVAATAEPPVLSGEAANIEMDIGWKIAADNLKKDLPKWNFKTKGSAKLLLATKEILKDINALRNATERDWMLRELSNEISLTAAALNLKIPTRDDLKDVFVPESFWDDLSSRTGMNF